MEMDTSIQQVFALAVKEAMNAKAESIEPVHLFIAACRNESAIIVDAFRAKRIDPVDLRRKARAIAHAQAGKAGGPPGKVSHAVTQALNKARKRADALGWPLDAGFVLSAVLGSPDPALRKLIEAETLPVDDLVFFLERASCEPHLSSVARESAANIGDPALVVPLPPLHAGHPATPALDKVGKDYTAMARAGKLEPVLGRKDEMKQIVRVLLRKEKSNPVLIGEAGVGKSAIVAGLAARAAGPDAPADIRDLRFVELMMSSIVAGTIWRGQFEERMQEVLKEAESDPRLVVFIDEIHMIAGAGSASGTAMDAANIMKPALARGAIRCIGATTPAEYAKHIEKDPALERRFQPVRIEEPSPEEAREILAGLRPHYEKHHGVKLTDEALDAAVSLSVRYLPDRRLPDKARDLIDQAAVGKRFLTFTPGATPSADEKVVTKDDVAVIVVEWTGIPLDGLTADRKERFLHMEDALRRRVIGQDAAVAAVAEVVRTAQAGLSRPDRPSGVFLFTGPTGVGKTELARALAEFLFGDERSLLRFDMSECMEEHSVSKLIGSPPGYVGHGEGGRLTDAVRRSPYCVVLFDEIEKAHPRVSDLFLQVFDTGRLTDSQGRTADFRNAVIIMTSNLRPALPDRERGPMGFKGGGPEPGSKDTMREALLSHFRPELLNRVGRVVEFEPLCSSHAREIVEKLLSQVRRRIEEKHVTLEVTPQALDVLARHAFTPEYGAREMERLIERDVVQPLAKGILEGRFKEGSKARLAAKGGRIMVEST